MSDRYLIVGLGNPGKKYQETRHNVGFRVLDRLAEKYQARFKRARAAADLAQVRHEKGLVLLAKPMTFMNNSGLAVVELVNYYKVDLPNLLVVYDDADLPLGRLRLRAQGSSGGHKGLASVISHLQSQSFPRLRLGIQSEEKDDMVDFVLSPFSKKERPEAELMIEKAVDAVELFLRLGLDQAMNRVNPE